MSTLGIVCFAIAGILFLYLIGLVIAGLTGHLSRMQADSNAFVEKLYPEYTRRSKAMAHTSRRYENHYLGV
jgi:hypothetical protein